MAQINFPTATSNGQTFEADNGVIYTYVGTPPNGFWSGSFQATGLTTLDARFLKLDSSNDPITGGLDITGGSIDVQLAAISNDTSQDIIHLGDGGIGGAGISLNRYTNAQNYGLSFFTTSGTASEKLRITNSGRVGIGTTSPNAKLEVVNSSTSLVEVARFRSEGNTNNPLLRIYADEANAKMRISTSGSNASDLTLGAGNSDHLMIKHTSGNVGIGTASPGGALEVQTAASESVIFDSAGGSQQPRITLQRAGGANYSLTNTLGQLLLERDGGEIYRHLSTNNTHRFVGTGQFNKPADWWSSSAFFGLPNLGHIGTEGSYRVHITSNGYRSTSGGWVGLGVNNYNGASQIGLDPTGKILFGGQQNKANGESAGVTVRFMMESQGDIRINQTATNTPGNGNNTTGAAISRHSTGSTLYVSRNNAVTAHFNRNNNGDIIQFRRNGAEQGDIRVSGSTVTYAGGHLSRFAQLKDNGDRIEILRGSVLSNIDQMCVWDYDAKDPELWTEDDEIPEGANVGDVKIEGREAGTELNEQLNRMKVSDVEGDPNVSGVFEDWDDDDQIYTKDFFCAMTGDFVIRIAQGTTVARGDLLMSAGDGTAKPQEDDIVRSKTIAKVSSTVITETYADGSYVVPCVLMAC